MGQPIAQISVVSEAKLRKRDTGAKSRSSVNLEVLPDGSLAQIKVAVSREHCLEMLNALAMAQIRVLSILQES